PTDGQLYLCGLRGWDTNAVKDGQFCRVRYTGKAVSVPVGLRVRQSGLEITFSAPLDRGAVEDDQNWAGEWGGQAGKVGRKPGAQAEMAIEAVRLAKDGRTVTVELNRVPVGVNYSIQYQLKAADGSPVSGKLHGTIHRAP